MATHSSILAWEIPWTEEPGQLQSMGSQRADVTEHARMLTHTVTYTHERKEQPQAKWQKRRGEEVKLGTVDGKAYIIC